MHKYYKLTHFDPFTNRATLKVLRLTEAELERAKKNPVLLKVEVLPEGGEHGDGGGKGASTPVCPFL